MQSKTTISTGNKFKGNPRKISEKQKRLLAEHLAELGDLSGVVYCHNNKAYVGGNQRADVFNGAEIDITERFESPTNHHTIAHGFIVWQGEKYVYREVAFTPEQFRKACIVANNDGGEFDFDVLKMEWDIGELSEWGLDLPDDLGIDIGGDDEGGGEPADAEPQIDKAKELNEKWGVKYGDLFLVGNHRLLCGDSTIREDVERLMGGEKADMVFTDPPYGIDVVGGAKAFGTVGGANIVKANNYPEIIGDNSIETAKKFYQVCIELGMKNFIVWGGNYFTEFLPPSKGWIVWDKKGRKWDDNFSDFEMAWSSFSKVAKIFTHVWMGMIQSGTREIRVHPTQKPSELIIDCIKYYMPEMQIVYDGFIGSGTTMLAAHNLKRRCFGCELSPDYVAVCLERMKTAFPTLEIRKEE